MKSLYIVAFITLSLNIYAQSNTTKEQEDQGQVLKNAKEQEAQFIKDHPQSTDKKPSQNILASEQGIESKKQDPKTQASTTSTGKTLPNTASFEEVLATIPNRQSLRKANNSRNTNPQVTGLPNTATLEEIKKTIPKN